VRDWRTTGLFTSWSALVATGALATRTAAQAAPAAQVPATPALIVNVHVVDSTGTAIEGADAAVLVGLSDLKATGSTDPSGRVSLSVPEPTGDYQLVVRKIGYNRSDQFFPGKRGRLTFDVVMRRTAQSLAPVRVTAREDLKRKSYFIDADEIAKHADELIDASDILRKLKPDMICGRSCRRGGGGMPSARSVLARPNAWVNGRRILTIVTDPVCSLGQRGMLAHLNVGTLQVLCEIRPEHIEQIQYIDEFDNSIGKIGSNNALFIALKEGVVYEPGSASYVREPTAPIAGFRAALPGVQTTASPPPALAPMPGPDSAATHRDSASALPAYRYRVLGVYDQDTGDVIEGARVFEVNTGTYANTSPTGTVSLVFLPEGSSLLRITKAGYEDLNLPVDIGPTATTPLTLLMKRKPEDHEKGLAVDGSARP
jgi:hypothetical protein